MLGNGVGQFFIGGALAYVGFAEAGSILLAPLAIHTVGLGGTLMVTGAVTGTIGWDLISKGWSDSSTTTSTPSAQIPAPIANVPNSASSGCK